jgi:glycosyltransferase involved in cell wall biosynthesis
MPIVERSRDVRTVSIVLPVHNQADHIAGVVEGCLDVLGRLHVQIELVLVLNACSDASATICGELAERHPRVCVVERATGGWGGAVRTGLAIAGGELLGYTNSARTSPEILALMLSYAQAYPEVVLKANRRIRDSAVRRAGSLLYNLECRALFDLPTWDINGTPKLFPRAFEQLRALRCEDDMIDAEFMLACKRKGYPIIEVPLLSTTRLGGRSTTNLRSALRMYRGALALRWRELGR